MAQPSAPRRDLCEDVTSPILAALESGTAPWSCPWDRSGEITLPINESTGAFYRDQHPDAVDGAARTGFSSARWMTYRQASDKGGQVRKGERHCDHFLQDAGARQWARRCRHWRGPGRPDPDAALVYRVQPGSDRRDRRKPPLPAVGSGF